MKEWIFSSFDVLLPTVVSAVLVYAIVIMYTRFFGLRSFSKMSSFDFAMTVAVGTLLSSAIINKSPSVVQSGVALLSLYLLQLMVALLRQKISWFSKVVDNQPLLLMDGPTILYENLRKAQLSEDDLRAKLREANVLNYSQVKAVVFETTGDISVLHTSQNTELDVDILQGVQGVSRLSD
uniref:DUF421 domain-containing protein n=1 Tax=Roseihalotalea indica TaxID=2867963 RepID=A0AA49GRK3_9BACT|nr:DUF421 domain-containing protein [Tunicatimonas sp. TK19036]